MNILDFQLLRAGDEIRVSRPQDQDLQILMRVVALQDPTGEMPLYRTVVAIDSTGDKIKVRFQDVELHAYRRIYE